MDFMRETQKLIRPVLLFCGGFTLFCLVYLSGYTYYDYQNFLKKEEASQSTQVHSLFKKAEKVSQNLEALADLTANRILATQGDPKKIQQILRSSKLISEEFKLPSLQKISYQKVSGQKVMINRFEIGGLSESLKISHIKNFVFDHESLSFKHPVFENSGDLDGILEIKISQNDLSSFLGNFSGLQYEFPPKNAVKSIQKSLKITLNPFTTFWDFFKERFFLYKIFMIFTTLCFFSVGIFLHFMHQKIKTFFKEEITNLRKNLSTKVQKLSEQLSQYANLQNAYQSFQTTSQAEIRFLSALNDSKKEKINFISRSLDFLSQAAESNTISLSEREQHEILVSCLQASKDIGTSTPTHLKSVKVQLNQLFSEISQIFADKIFKNKLSIEFQVESHEILQGDTTYIKFLFVNFIGRAIHRVPKNGHVKVITREHPGGVSIQVQDNGFQLSKKHLSLIEEKNPIFVAETLLHKSCQENGIRYSYSKIKNGDNQTKLIILEQHKEMQGENVVQLFK